MSEWLTTGLGSVPAVTVALPVTLGSVEVLHSTMAVGGQVMAGAIVSPTIMVWRQLLSLPQASVAVQVRVMTVVFGQLPGAVLSLWVMVGAGSQLSVAVALPVTLGSVGEFNRTVFFGGHVTIGGRLSFTVIVCLKLAVLPQLSPPVQVRVM